MQLSSYLQQEVWGPLGITDTGFKVKPESHYRLVELTLWDKEEGRLLRPHDIKEESRRKGMKRQVAESARACDY